MMIRSTQLLAWAVSYLLIDLHSARAEEFEKIDLEQIKSRAARWRASFVNLRVIEEVRSLSTTTVPLLEMQPPLDPRSAPQFLETEWWWVNDVFLLVDHKSFYWTADRTGTRTLSVFNGAEHFRFEAAFRQSPAAMNSGATGSASASSSEETGGSRPPLATAGEEFVSLHIRSGGSSKHLSRSHLICLRGLYNNSSGEWLTDHLNNSDCKLEGVESLFGGPCAKINISFQDQQGSIHTEILWLDLEHDCLARRIQWGSQEIVVDEIQQLEGGIWFPKILRFRLGHDHNDQLVVVTKAEVNTQVDRSRFGLPKPEPGTRVSDSRYTPVAQAEQVPGLGNQEQDPVYKLARGPAWLKWMILTVLLLICLAVVMEFRKKSKRE